MSNTGKLGDDFRNVSLSKGTLIVDDLFDNFKHLLNNELIEAFDSCLTESMKSEVLTIDIFDYLNEIAPEGCYFGAHPGDGSDFGFWEFEEDEV